MGLTYIEERMSAKDSKKIWVKIKRDKRVQPPKNEEGAQAEKPSGSTELSAELSNLAGKLCRLIEVTSQIIQCMVITSSKFSNSQSIFMNLY